MGNTKIGTRFVFIALVLAAFSYPLTAQTSRPPLFQNIQVSKPEAKPTPPKRIRRTTSSRALGRAVPITGGSTLVPSLATVKVPGRSGMLVESLDGRVVYDSFSSATFNPASNVKTATSYAVLRTFGPNYRFRTDVWTDGIVDPNTGTLTGNVFVSGRDPVFNMEQGVHLANELNRLGINRIDGDLIVTDNFAMNFSNSSRRSALTLKRTLDASRRTRGAGAAWRKFRLNSSRLDASINPSVAVVGDVFVEGLPTNARLLFSHESAPLREIVKVTMSYSNNFLSERLGDMLGGAYAVARIVQLDARVPANEFTLQTCSGLGINRVSPRAQIRLLRIFRALLQRNGMKFSDVMPVAGMDDGTLRRRFTGTYIGSVVGKTGTLGRTDRGVSTLAGEVSTRSGTYLFVIFNQVGSVARFRGFQNSFVPMLTNALGGPLPMRYAPQDMSKRTAKTRIKFPGRSRRS